MTSSNNVSKEKKMSQFSYSDSEKEINKVLKYNKDRSEKRLADNAVSKEADAAIAESKALLRSLGREDAVRAAEKAAEEARNASLPKLDLKLRSWEEIVAAAEGQLPDEVALEDILSQQEIAAALKERDDIEADFSKRTGINNKTDLSFLAVATGLQVVKSLLFPYVAKKVGYGNPLDKAGRSDHNDPDITREHKKGVNDFLNRHQGRKGQWRDFLTQTPPYDTTVGSKDLKINMGGGYHRFCTLGHDPVLGWLFGTANIMTDVVTLNTFQSFRVTRTPRLRITAESVDVGTLFLESFQVTQADYLNLPAAVTAQALHLKSDVYTKLGLPVPMLGTFSEKFASKLYREHYDTACLIRDAMVVKVSYQISVFIDAIIALVHGLFIKQDEAPRLYEVRTRKILLISNALATGSSALYAYCTKNVKNFDLGSALNTAMRLVMDVRFMIKLRNEFIEQEIDRRLQAEIDKIDALYKSL